MKINYYTQPYEHFIIDDFLTPRVAAQVLDEAIKLRKFYKEAQVGGGNHNHVDDCDHCLQQKNIRTSSIRSNQTVYLNQVFPDETRHKCVTTSFLDTKLFTYYLSNIIEQKKGIWKLWKAVNTNDVQISRYGKCDFYDWHCDPIPNTEEKRIFTIVYYVNKEPAGFKGGQIKLGNIENPTIIEPKHNRLVIFPSDNWHCVENVHICSEDWDAGRFSINYWAGFDNECKIRKEINQV